MEDIKVISKKVTEIKGESSVICPFCQQNNINNKCIHFLKKWESPYVLHSSKEKLCQDVYYFTNKINEEARPIENNQPLFSDTKITAYSLSSYTENMVNYSVVLVSEDKIVHTIKGSSQKYIEMRNIAGELFAAGTAIQWAVDNGYGEITVCYDYTGIAAWANNKWQATQPGTINYKRFIDSLKDKININFVKADKSSKYYSYVADMLKKLAVANSSC